MLNKIFKVLLRILIIGFNAMTIPCMAVFLCTSHSENLSSLVHVLRGLNGVYIAKINTTMVLMALNTIKIRNKNKLKNFSSYKL